MGNLTNGIGHHGHGRKISTVSMPTLPGINEQIKCVSVPSINEDNDIIDPAHITLDEENSTRLKCSEI